MKCYEYNAETKEFIGEGFCQIDPLETELKGENVYLLPANAVFEEPPEEQDGFARVWNGIDWVQLEDHRGVEYWLEGDTWKSEPHVMTELGALLEGALLERPEKTQEEIEAEELAQAKQERAEAVSKITVEVDGMVFDGDEDSQTRMSRTITVAKACELPETETINWVLADNTIADVTVKQLAQALYLAGLKQTELWVKPYSE